MKKTISLILVLILLVTGLCGCQKNGGEKDGKINISVTIFPIYDFVRAVTGKMANTELIIKAGSDIHSFEPSFTDITAIEESDLFVYIGGESDVWVDKMLKSTTKTEENTLKMFDCVPLLSEDGDEDEYDEHIWTSPGNAKIMVKAIAEKLGQIYPEFGAEFAKNADDYAKKIDDEAQKTKEVIENAAKPKKIVVCDRFPFKYFAEYYGLSYEAAFSGCESDTDADLATVTRLISSVKDSGLSAVYKIEMSQGNVAQTVSSNTGAKILELNSAQNVPKEDFDRGITYIDIMAKNREALYGGLN